MIFSVAAAIAAVNVAKADPVDLTAYVDAKGFLDVQTLACEQLANTYQEDADALMSWYSGWYNGLDHKHYLDHKKGRIAEHDVIEYRKRTGTRRSFTRLLWFSKIYAPSRA